MVWDKENRPLGEELGHPKCCIDTFYTQPPDLNTKSTVSNKIRHEAACINGVFTGFIPCEKHAKKIIDGESKPKGLIKNRDSKFFRIS